MGDVSIYTKLNWNGNSVIQLPWACHPLWSTTPQRWSSLGVLYAPVSNPSTMLFKLPKLIGLPRWTWVESLHWAVISVLSLVNRHLYTSLPRTVSTESHGCFWELQATQPPTHIVSTRQGAPSERRCKLHAFWIQPLLFYDTLSGLSKTHVLLHEKEKLWLNCLNYEGAVQQFPRAFELSFFYGFIIPSFGSLSAFCSQCRSVMDCHSKMFLWQGDFLPEPGVNYEVGNLGASRRLSYFIFIHGTSYSQSPFSSFSHFTLPNTWGKAGNMAFLCLADKAQNTGWQATMRFLPAKVLPVPQTPCGSWHELPNCQWRCWFKLSYSGPLCHRQEPQSPHLIVYLVSLNQSEPRQHPLADASSRLDSSYSRGASVPRFFLYSSNSNRSSERHLLCCV